MRDDLATFDTGSREQAPVISSQVEAEIGEMVAAVSLERAAAASERCEAAWVAAGAAAEVEAELAR